MLARTKWICSSRASSAHELHSYVAPHIVTQTSGIRARTLQQLRTLSLLCGCRAPHHSTDGDGVLTLKELIESATNKMNQSHRLSESKINDLEKKLGDIVPRLQNRENFARSYSDILGELYMAVQVENVVKSGSRKSVLFQAFDVSGICDIAASVAESTAGVVPGVSVARRRPSNANKLSCSVFGGTPCMVSTARRSAASRNTPSARASSHDPNND